MNALGAVTFREFASFFRIPLGWIVIALFFALSAVFFTVNALTPGEAATMRPFFTIWWSLVLFLAPAVSMRLFSEEMRTGTIEPLLTAPVHESTIVAGKYLGAVLYFVAMLAPTLIFVVLLEVLSRPDYGPIISGYLGILLLGMLYIAVGTLASALTSSQTLAFLSALFVLLIVDIVAWRAAMAAAPESVLSTFLFWLSPGLRMSDFAKGVIDMGHVAYFVAASVWCLMLATVAIESRRWR